MKIPDEKILWNFTGWQIKQDNKSARNETKNFLWKVSLLSLFKQRTFFEKIFSLKET